MSSATALPAPAGRPAMSTTTWLICVIAAIGFAFDIYELLMLPLVIGPALQELGGLEPGSPAFRNWASVFFYIPALLGGAFGLVGGYLTDLLGRRRVLTWSILLYACSAFAAGFSQDLYTLLFFRTTTFIGVCVEFVAAVAWLAELFEDPHQREKVLGYTQAFSSIGGLLVAVAFGVANGISPEKAWRYTLMSGLIPAIPLIVIRPFLPESPRWSAKRAAGTLKRPSIGQLFSPELRQTTIVTTLMFACSYGMAFGSIQQMPLIVPAIKPVQEKVAEQAKVPMEKAKEKAAEKAKADGLDADGTKKLVAEAAAKARSGIGRKVGQAVASDYTKAQEIGGLLGRFVLAAVVLMFASQRTLLRVFLLPGLIVLPLVFVAFGRGAEQSYCHLDISFIPGFHSLDVSFLGLLLLVGGFFVVAQFSFWGNYLPRVYPVHLRGTGESFAANIGGRMIGTLFYGVTQQIAGAFTPKDATPPVAAQQIAYTAAAVVGSLFLMNLFLSFFLPEPKAEVSED